VLEKLLVAEAKKRDFNHGIPGIRERWKNRGIWQGNDWQRNAEQNGTVRTSVTIQKRTKLWVIPCPFSVWTRAGDGALYACHPSVESGGPKTGKEVGTMKRCLLKWKNGLREKTKMPFF
jgi:hypothetical protein